MLMNVCKHMSSQGIIFEIGGPRNGGIAGFRQAIGLVRLSKKRKPSLVFLYDNT